MTFDVARWHHLIAHAPERPVTEWRWGMVTRTLEPPCPWCVAGDFSPVAVEPDESVYVTPATAAAMLEASVQRVHALRKRGKLRSVGMTAAEYKRAREAAGWGDAQGWGPGVFYLREDVEALAKGRLFK